MTHPEGPFRRSPFDHRQHLKFAWTVLGEQTLEAAIDLAVDEIRGFADVHAPGRYHDTITRFYMRLLAHTRSVDDGAADFEGHLSRFPLLLDKHSLEKHYSLTLLASPVSREGFVEPDLLPLP